MQLEVEQSSQVGRHLLQELTCQQKTQKIAYLACRKEISRSNIASYKCSGIWINIYLVLKMVDNVTLGYWAIRGRGQVPRLLLAYTGTHFTSKVYKSPEEWFGKDKNGLGLPFPNLPYLIDGNVKLTESDAICRYIIARSKHTELLGKNPQDAALIDNIIGVIHDIQTPVMQLCMSDKFEEDKNKVYDEKVKAKVQQVYKFIGEKEWALGYLTLADFRIAEAVNYLEGIWPEHFKEFPKLAALRDKFNHLEAVKKYYEGADAIKGPFLPPSAKWH